MEVHYSMVSFGFAGYQGQIQNHTITFDLPGNIDTSKWHDVDYKIPFGSSITFGDITGDHGVFTISGNGESETYNVVFMKQEKRKGSYTLLSPTDRTDHEVRINTKIVPNSDTVKSVSIVYYEDKDKVSRVGLPNSGGSMVITGIQNMDNFEYYMEVETQDGVYKTSPHRVTASSEKKDVKSKWKKENDRWQYQDDNGDIIKDRWKEINSIWYYFDEKGNMLSNQWLQQGDKWYFLQENGAMFRGAQMDKDGVSYIFTPEGYVLSDTWITDGHGDWQYALPDSKGLAKDTTIGKYRFQGTKLVP